MKLLAALFLGFMPFYLISQSSAPPVYINFVSHNEPGDSLDEGSHYNAMKTKVLTLAAIIDSYNAAWNLQTCAGMVKGAITTDGIPNNLFRTLGTSPYVDNIEIDPRYKNVNIFGTMADLYHVLGVLGANRTYTLGGFLVEAGQEDWFPYESPQFSTSNMYPTETWQCQIMWGAASLSHTNDVDNWGIWKPDTTSNFYAHNPSRAIWYIGNGCSPENTQAPLNPGSFDSTDNVSDITNVLKGFIDSLQNHLLPWDKFYNYSITINQSSFGPTLFSKISQICDSVKAWGTDKIQWSLLTDRLTKLQAWSTANSIDYSQWECGEVDLSVNETDLHASFELFPNPAADMVTIRTNQTELTHVVITDLTGKLVLELDLNGETTIQTSSWENGTYFLQDEQGVARKILIVH